MLYGCCADSLLDGCETDDITKSMLTYLEGIKPSPHICILRMWTFQHLFAQWNKSGIATVAESNGDFNSSTSISFPVLFQTFFLDTFFFFVFKPVLPFWEEFKLNPGLLR